MSDLALHKESAGSAGTSMKSGVHIFAQGGNHVLEPSLVPSHDCRDHLPFETFHKQLESGQSACCQLRIRSHDF
jgi:hypothetical protein